MQKFDHIDAQYRRGILKGYEHFTLVLNDDQKHLGKSIAWLVRPGTMQRHSQLSDAETLELRLVEQEFEKAIETLWHFDHMNYAWLGNLFHEHGGHGHMHLVPRYAGPREFADLTFTDDTWGNNFPQSRFKPSEEVFLSIRDALRAKIPGSERD